MKELIFGILIGVCITNFIWGIVFCFQHKKNKVEKGNKKQASTDYASLIKVLQENKEDNAIKVLEVNHEEIEKNLFFKSANASEHEVIAIISPPISERWMVSVRNFKSHTYRVYNGDGLQYDQIIQKKDNTPNI